MVKNPTKTKFGLYPINSECLIGKGLISNTNTNHTATAPEHFYYGSFVSNLVLEIFRLKMKTHLSF